MKIESFPVALIDVRKRMRPVDPRKVAALAESIAKVGLLNPITVFSPDANTLDLIAGLHRLEAVRSLGWEDIDAIVFSGGEIDCQLAEIDENLVRSELTPTERAEHEARRKELWEAKDQQVDQLEPPVEVKKHGHAQAKGFAESTAAVTGESKPTINRNVKRGTEICQEARDLIRGTALDKGAYLDRLLKQQLSPREQCDHVRDDLQALADKEAQRARREESAERERAAAEQRKDAMLEACQFLFEKLTAREWSYLITTIDNAGGSLRADQLRKWEPVAGRVAA